MDGNQIVFTALNYSLLQQQILRQGRKVLNKASKRRMIEELPTIMRCSTSSTTDMVLAVPESAREKLRELTKRKRSRSRVSAATDGSP